MTGARTCGGGSATGQPRVLVLAHHDTVWPLGSLETHPFSVADGVLRGPGCFDMKAGLVLALHALAVLGVPDGVTLLVTGDEELGSPSSRGADRGRGGGLPWPRSCSRRRPTAARSRPRARACRCTRCGRSGRAAHAGLEPERGVNATVELAHQVLAVAGLADAALGTTVTPTALSSGTVANTVPAAGAFSVDVRMWDAAEQARVHAAMSSLLPAVPDAVLADQRRAQPAAAARVVLGRAVLARVVDRRRARPGAAHVGVGRRGVRRELHRRGGDADARRAWRGRRRGAC